MRIKLIIYFMALISGRAFSFSFPIKPFETDNCTMFPDGPKSRIDCCVEHDIYYWIAGHRILMDKADKELFLCIKNSEGSLLANIMYYGVRSGHYSPIQNKYKWGWAQKEGEDGVRPSIEELGSIIEHLQNKNISKNILTKVKSFYLK